MREPLELCIVSRMQNVLQNRKKSQYFATSIFFFCIICIVQGSRRREPPQRGHRFVEFTDMMKTEKRFQGFPDRAQETGRERKGIERKMEREGRDIVQGVPRSWLKKARDNTRTKREGGEQGSGGSHMGTQKFQAGRG